MPREIPIAIVRAAEVRAQGGSWAAAAKAAEWTEHGLRRWVLQHKELWAREVGHAWRGSREEACAESVAVLRKNLRDEDKKLALESTKVIGGKFQPKPKSRPTPPKDVAGQFFDLLAAIPEGQTTRVDRHIQASEDEGRATRS